MSVNADAKCGGHKISRCCWLPFFMAFLLRFYNAASFVCFKSVWLCVCAGMSGRFLRQYFQINNIKRDLLIKFLLCRSGIGKLYRFCPLIGPPPLGFGFRLGSTRLSFWRHTCESFLLQIGQNDHQVPGQTVLTAFLAFARYRSDLFCGFGHFNGAQPKNQKSFPWLSPKCFRFIHWRRDCCCPCRFLTIFVAFLYPCSATKSGQQQKEEYFPDTHQVIHQVLPPQFTVCLVHSPAPKTNPPSGKYSPWMCVRRLKLFKGF